MNNYEKYKRLIRFLAGVLLIGIQSWIFMQVWIHCYNEHMEMPYQRMGHYFLAAVYAVMLYVSSSMYGSLRLGYFRNGELIYTHTLATICANAVSYIPIVLLVKHFKTVMPLVLMTAGQFVIICIWGYLANGIYRKLYPPRKVIMIYGERPVAALMNKLNSREDCFEIGEVVKIQTVTEELKEKLLQYEGVVICDIPSKMRNELLKFCYGKSLRVYSTPKISDIIIRSAESMHYFDTPLLLSRNDGLSIEQAFIKRAMDVVGSLVLIVLTSPIMLGVAIGVKLSSPGPIIFKQERVGLNKRPFMMYKFRSMRVNAAEDSAWSTNSDPRKTRFGSIIRKFSLDELPQFFNVLKGDMSLVGPRPEIPFHVEHFKEEIPRYLVRQQVRPGLTGWAQINGLRGDTDIAERIRYDIWYIENWTVALDIKILFRTVFGGKMVNDEKIQ